MKIAREVGGKNLEFELTMTELMLAFEEYQHNCDVEDVMYMADFYYDEPEEFYERFGIRPDQLYKIADQCAERYRKYVGGNNSECWSDYVADAIRDTVRRLGPDSQDEK